MAYEPKEKRDVKDGEYHDADLLQQAISIVDDERKRWFDAVSFVTDQVAFQMRNLIRKLRKNYWGVFDVPKDPTTGRDKVWVPLTRTLVEGSVKNIDLDTKDINFRAKVDKGFAVTHLIRALVRKWLDNNYFGETLDEMERQLAIDGTVVWKTLEGEDENGRPTVIRKTVDLLNVYIDPTEDNIQTAYRFTERSLMLPEEIKAMSGWMNTEGLFGSTTISRVDGQYSPTSNGSTAKYRDLWECWGKIPKNLITGKKSDKDTLVDGHIVVSGLEVRDPKCHLVEMNTKKDADGRALKPYEEVRYAKVSNRWYGLGIAERVLMLQIWINTIVNIRINRSYIAQLGLFKIRKGSGITPQMLSRLSANGAVVVNDPADIEQMQMQEASQASYSDESNIMDWAQRDTGAYDVSVGEPTPASKPATTSVLENNSAKSGFKMVKDSISMFVERWIDRHVLPILAKTVNVGEMIEILNDDTTSELIDSVVASEASKKLESMWAMGVVPTAENMQAAIENMKNELMKKPNMFIKLVKKLVSSHVYTKVFMTNEEMDPSVMVQNILSIMRFVPPEAQMPLVKESMDLMGLDFTIPKPQPQAPQQKVSQTINYRDLPPEGQAQMAQEAGIKISAPQPMGGQQTGSVTPQGQGGIMSALQGNNPQPQITSANTLR